MASLLELSERINKGELIDPQQLEVYQDSTNAAEKFLANHAGAMLALRRSHTHLLEALEAIDYADQKVLFQFLSVLGFLGLTDQRTRPVMRFGAAAVRRREIGLALEAFQSSVTADLAGDGPFVRDGETAAFVARQYERAAAAIGWYPPGPCDWQNPQLKIGYVTTTLADDEAPARLLGGMARHLDAKHTKLHVYATEAGVRREKQAFTQGPFAGASSKKGRDTIDQLTRRRASLWFAPLDQDLAAAARELATQIHKDQIDVLIVDAGPTDPVAAVLACWRPAKAKLHLCRRVAIRSGDADAVVYFDAHRRAADAAHWLALGTPAHVVADGVEPMALDAAVPQRSAYGIPDSAIVLATVLGEGDGPVTADFIDAVIACLRQHPTAVLLATGDADTAAFKRRLDTAGLGKRAGFTGRRKDTAEFLKMADVVLTPFGRPTAAGTLAAMTAGRPCVTLASDTAGPHAGGPNGPGPHPAVALLGDEHAAADVAAFVDRVGRLVRDPALRARCGESLRQRAAERFGLEQTVRSIEAVARALLESAVMSHPPAAQAA